LAIRFSTFQQSSLKKAPSILMIGRYKLEFDLFSQPINSDKTPVVFLGGAFQSFTSLKEVGEACPSLLFHQIARLNDNEHHRYVQNTQRLLRFEGFDKSPTCPTLVATGEFDNVTLPQGNAFLQHLLQIHSLLLLKMLTTYRNSNAATSLLIFLSIH
jgi:hypothetical protein